MQQNWYFYLVVVDCSFQVVLVQLTSKLFRILKYFIPLFLLEFIITNNDRHWNDFVSSSHVPLHYTHGIFM
jgi:hypothetical protein